MAQQLALSGTLCVPNAYAGVSQRRITPTHIVHVGGFLKKNGLVFHSFVTLRAASAEVTCSDEELRHLQLSSFC